MVLLTILLKHRFYIFLFLSLFFHDLVHDPIRDLIHDLIRDPICDLIHDLVRHPSQPSFA